MSNVNSDCLDRMLKVLKRKKYDPDQLFKNEDLTIRYMSNEDVLKWAGTVAGDINKRQRGHITSEDVRQALLNNLKQGQKDGQPDDLFRCAVTGSKFSEVDCSFDTYRRRDTKYRWNLLKPSVDRIDSEEDYSASNIRIVTRGVNLMMQEWGFDIFYMPGAACHTRYNDLCLAGGPQAIASRYAKIDKLVDFSLRRRRMLILLERLCAAYPNTYPEVRGEFRRMLLAPYASV